MVLVHRGEFVIIRYRVAISYSVILGEPVISNRSGYLKKDRLATKGICGIVASYGNKPVKIDDLPGDLRELCKVNETCYLDYEGKCLTSANSQWPNVSSLKKSFIFI